jgi:aspartate ammonia-lyase
MAAEAGVFELNAMEPIIALSLLQSAHLLQNACTALTEKCVRGITANRERCRRYVENSIGIVTALNPVLGYDRSASVAEEALQTGGSVYALVLARGWLTREQLDDLLRPEDMTHPRQIPQT